jgi:hypothetical protein
MHRRFALALLPLFALACSEQSRLWRIFPWSDSNAADPERVNFFPLAYADSKSAAILWPLMDFDERGFAIRPLVAKDDDDLDVLWPLSHFDLATGEGWALNAYSIDGNVGLFPLANFGPDLNFVALAWWFPETPARDSSYGLFPLFTCGDLRQIGPVWWSKEEDGPFGLFPIVWGARDGDQLAVLPLYYQDLEPGHELRIALVPPTWWQTDGSDELAVVFPLFLYHADGGHGELITLLGGRGWDADGNTDFLDLLGPVFYRGHDGDGATTALLWPLFVRTASPLASDTWLAAGLAHVGTSADGLSWRLWPLASASNDEACDDWIDRVTLFRHERRGDASETWLVPLYFGQHAPDHARDELLFSLARRVRTNEGSSWRLWPLVSNSTADTSGAVGLHDFVDDCTLVGLDRRPERTHFHAGTPLLFDLDRSGAARDSWDARLLALITGGHSVRPPAEGERVIRERNYAGFLFDWFDVERSLVQERDGTTHQESHYRLPLLHEYESTPDRKEWDLLCYAVHSETTPAAEKFSVLGYAYRSTTTATETHRDMFPAITYDRTPDGSRFSFLWHLFHYEKHGERTGGHILFVPWGD